MIETLTWARGEVRIRDHENPQLARLRERGMRQEYDALLQLRRARWRAAGLRRHQASWLCDQVRAGFSDAQIIEAFERRAAA